MSDDTLNFATLAANSAAQRAAQAARVSGKVPTPDPDPVASGEEVNAEGVKVLGNLSPAETADLIARAESGNALALDIIEKAVEAAAPMQAGDAGATGKRGQAVNPWNLAEAHIRKAIQLGRRRQTGR
jgi:hypothetical protein